MGVGKLGAIYSKSLQNLRMWWGEVHRLGMELPKVNIKKSPISRQLKQSFLQWPMDSLEAASDQAWDPSKSTKVADASSGPDSKIKGDNAC